MVRSLNLLLNVFIFITRAIILLLVCLVIIDLLCVFASVMLDIIEEIDVGCGPIFSMNMTMGVKITCETLTNSLAVPLLPMQQISTLWIFVTPHTCAHSRRP
jgi:hypothetical protein